MHSWVNWRHWGHGDHRGGRDWHRDGRREQPPAQPLPSPSEVSPSPSPTSAPVSEPASPPPASAPTSPPPATTEPVTVAPTTSTPTAAPTTTAPKVTAWAPFKLYLPGQVVSFQGVNYRVLAAHTSLPGWEPSKLPLLFKALG